MRIRGCARTSTPRCQMVLQIKNVFYSNFSCLLLRSNRPKKDEEGLVPVFVDPTNLVLLNINYHPVCFKTFSQSFGDLKFTNRNQLGQSSLSFAILNLRFTSPSFPDRVEYKSHWRSNTVC